MQPISNEEINRLIKSVDYTEALSLTAGPDDVRQSCADARKLGFRAVVTYPQYVGQTAAELQGSAVLVQLPIGYPCGGQTTSVKCFETEEGIRNGATDFDMVMNLSAFKNSDFKKVSDEITAVRKIVKSINAPFKVIIETGILTDEEKKTAARLAVDCGANFIKTCTGIGPGRATVHDIRLIRSVIGDRAGIKASGFVASVEDGISFMRAGADIVALKGFMLDQLAALEWNTGA